jgi:adenine-specific DNA-methyltransferase
MTGTTPIDTIIQGDCLEEMKKLPPNSINLIYTDPPYFKVKDEPWDNQWENPAKFIDWIGDLCQEWQRILKPNGSLYVFASPKMAARVECKIGEYFNVLGNIRWIKAEGWHHKSVKEELRSYLSPWEACIFAEHFGSDNIAKGEAGYGAKCDELRGFLFEPIRAYLDGEKERAGFTTRQVAEAFQKKTGSRTVTGMAGHWFTSVQWTLPTEENYLWLKDLLNSNQSGRPVPPYEQFHEAPRARFEPNPKPGANEYLRADYEDLRADYEYLRADYEDLRADYEDLRRPFQVTSEVPYTDVWDFPTVGYYEGKHPCEKPIEMSRHVIAASSRPGDVVLDCFGGSCQVADACIQLGRKYIIIEQNAEYCRQARKRVSMIQPEAAQKRIAAVPARLDRWAEA